MREDPIGEAERILKRERMSEKRPSAPLVIAGGVLVLGAVFFLCAAVMAFLAWSVALGIWIARALGWV